MFKFTRDLLSPGTRISRSRAAVRFMYVEIVKEYKKRVPGVAINPIDNLAIDGVGMLSQAKTLTVA